MNNIKLNGTSIFIHENVKVGKNVSIGHCSCIGFGNPENGEIIIEDNVEIGAFCVIHFGTVIKKNSFIDHYTKIGEKVLIGENTKVLYGKHIYDKVEIGNNCIIGGNIADRTIIEDNVTYFGEIVHSHRDANLAWDETEEPSPIIKKGSVIGAESILIGDREIGPHAYIGAGEIVRTDVNENYSLIKGELKPLKDYRGIIKAR